jgi:hypothetical protein
VDNHIFATYFNFQAGFTGNKLMNYQLQIWRACLFSIHFDLHIHKKEQKCAEAQIQASQGKLPLQLGN